MPFFNQLIFRLPYFCRLASNIKFGYPPISCQSRFLNEPAQTIQHHQVAL